MRPLRHAAVDLAALAFVLFAVVSGAGWAYTVVVAYTALMVVLKLAAVVAKMKPPRPSDAPPEWVYHAIYGVTVAALVWAGWAAGDGGRGWFALAAAWAAIWALSAFAARR